MPFSVGLPLRRASANRKREPLADFAQRKGFYKLRATSQPPGQHFQRGESNLRMLKTKQPHVPLINEEHCRLFFSRHRRGIRAVIEDRHFGHGCPGTLGQHAQSLLIQLFEEGCAPKSSYLIHPRSIVSSGK